MLLKQEERWKLKRWKVKKPWPPHPGGQKQWHRRKCSFREETYGAALFLVQRRFCSDDRLFDRWGWPLVFLTFFLLNFHLSSCLSCSIFPNSLLLNITQSRLYRTYRIYAKQVWAARPQISAQSPPTWPTLARTKTLPRADTTLSLCRAPSRQNDWLEIPRKRPLEMISQQVDANTAMQRPARSDSRDPSQSCCTCIRESGRDSPQS
jgi:hypothetical protein